MHLKTKEEIESRLVSLEALKGMNEILLQIAANRKDLDKVVYHENRLREIKTEKNILKGRLKDAKP